MPHTQGLASPTLKRFSTQTVVMSIESSPEKSNCFDPLAPLIEPSSNGEALAPCPASSSEGCGQLHLQSTVPMNSRQQRMYAHLPLPSGSQRWRDVHLEGNLSAPGPTTHTERHLWTERCWTASTPDMRDRLVRNIQRLRVATFMSGMGCMELILFQIAWLLEQLIPNFEKPKFVSACDCALTRVVTLSDFDKEWSAEHIYWKIEELLPEDLKADILAEVPKQDVPLRDRQEAYTNIQATIRTWFQQDDGQNMRCFAAACAKHGLQCPSCSMDLKGTDLEKEPLTMTAAGVDCTDTTRQGKQKGTAGPSRLGHIVWSALQGQLQPDVVLGECTQDWLPIDLADDLSADYDITKCELKPEYFGDPYNRPRAVVEGRNRSKAGLFFFS